MANKQINNINEPEASQTWEKIWNERSMLISGNKTWLEMLPSTNSYATKKYKDTLINNHVEKNNVNQLFFSTENIQNIDNRLRYTVYIMSNNQYHLGPQNKQELVIIMRAIYVNYSQNVEEHVVEQVENLNKIIISRIAPELYSKATQYLKYLEDANESHKILLARPTNVNNTGLKVLPMGNAIGI